MTSPSFPSTPVTLDPSIRAELIKNAEALVQDHMRKYDPSHDWFHVNRVRNTALRLARTLAHPHNINGANGSSNGNGPQNGDGVVVDELLVELVALFHDMAAKYTSTLSLLQTLSPFLAHPLTTTHLPPAFLTQITTLIPLISWSSEKKSRASGEWQMSEGQLRGEGGWEELCCVQDADRLDAIGAFGIMRCSAYSSATNHPLHVPSLTPSELSDLSPELKADYQEKKRVSAIEHFGDKLLHIKDRLKTPAGKAEGLKRHQTMLTFLAAVDDELREDW